jgi:glycosyltransferase involved in cell wall biosynthesis
VLQLLVKYYVKKMPSESSALVSVIVPVFNRANLIGRTISSVLSQTFHNFELIIIDDGSTDDLDFELAKFSDERIKLHRFKRNYGVSAARNTGISLAKGSAILFLDSDDELYADCLSEMTNELSILDLDAIACRARFLDDDVLPSNSQLVEFSRAESKLGQLLMGNIFPLSCLMFSSRVKSSMKFDEAMRSYEDLDFLLNFFSQEKKFESLSKTLVLVNDTPGSVNKDFSSICNALSIIQIKYSEILNKNTKVNFYFRKNFLSFCLRAGRIKLSLVLFAYLAADKEIFTYAKQRLGAFFD